MTNRCREILLLSKIYLLCEEKNLFLGDLSSRYLNIFLFVACRFSTSDFLFFFFFIEILFYEFLLKYNKNLLPFFVTFFLSRRKKNPAKIVCGFAVEKGC